MSNSTLECLDSGSVYDIEEAPVSMIKKMYESCCQEYVRRLCELWEIYLKEAWWVADRIGTELCIADAPWCLSMEQVIYIVEHKISHNDFMEWWDFVESEIHTGKQHPRINFHSWFSLGARPEMLNNDTE